MYSIITCDLAELGRLDTGTWTFELSLSQQSNDEILLVLEATHKPHGRRGTKRPVSRKIRQVPLYYNSGANCVLLRSEDPGQVPLHAMFGTQTVVRGQSPFWNDPAGGTSSGASIHSDQVDSETSSSSSWPTTSTPCPVGLWGPCGSPGQLKVQPRKEAEHMSLFRSPRNVTAITPTLSSESGFSKSRSKLMTKNGSRRHTTQSSRIPTSRCSEWVEGSL